VPNEQANKRPHKEEDAKAKKVFEVGTRRDKAPTSFQIGDTLQKPYTPKSASN
jgi:hypothetical protein